MSFWGYKSQIETQPITSKSWAPGDPVNILASSTRQWNPGDEFILFGIRNLFREAIGERAINWILYDRNPDLNVNGFRDRKRRGKILSNSFHGHDPQSLDLAVIAGTPEWFGPPLTQFYEAIQEAGLPLFAVGVGYIDAPIPFSRQELHCLRNLAEVVIARDEYASRALDGADIRHHRLPCPALFASLREETPAEILKIGFILQTSETVNQSIPRNLTRECVDAMTRLRAEGRRVDVICHYIDELSEFSRILSPVRYSYDARDYIDILADYDLILSTRLHGAVLANSLGRPAVLLNQDDSRCRGAAALFPFIYSCRPENVSDQIKTIEGDPAHGLPAWKSRIKEQYLDLLREAFARVFQYVIEKSEL